MSSTPSTLPGERCAANGHPEPYDVNYVEIGNEDWFSSTYPDRYPLFYDAIRAEFPALKIIATSTATGGRPYDVLDDHFYNTANWFMANSHLYDNVPRGSFEIIVGEYAAREGSPTNTMAAALGDAAFLMGLMRNSDLVTMSAYAPLWANVNGIQWAPDLIGFNNTTSYGSPSYYAQVILSQNHGTTIVSDTVSGANGLQVLTTKTDSTYFVTVVNTQGTPNETTVNLVGAASVSPTATSTTISASASNAVNSIANPTNIAPITSTVTGLDASFTYTFPAYSLTVLEFTATVDMPSVAIARCGNSCCSNRHNDGPVGLGRCHRRRSHPQLHLVGDRTCRGELQRQWHERRQEHDCLLHPSGHVRVHRYHRESHEWSQHHQFCHRDRRASLRWRRHPPRDRHGCRGRYDATDCRRRRSVR